MSESTGVMSVIADMAMKLFKKSTFVHEFYVHKNKLKMCFGIKIPRLFSAIVTVKSREKITTVTLNVNGYKYKLYLATGKVMNAIRVTLMYIKARITKDAKTMRKLNAITINRKDYKSMKLNKKRLLKAVTEKSEKNERKGVPQVNGMYTEPLVIKFGRTGPSPKFEEAKVAVAM